MQYPPPLPDRPGIEGELWREDVNLTHLLPHEREKVSEFSVIIVRCGMDTWDMSTLLLIE
jgi:hypothetical protein